MYFQSNILKSNGHYQSIQVRKKLFKESFVQFFLKNSQNSQEKTCVGGLFNELEAILKWDYNTSPRQPIVKNICERLFLDGQVNKVIAF